MTIVRIDIAEFRRLGYLQELNRRFLHPLGLALEVIHLADGTEELGGVWDYRTDPEGLRFGDLTSDEERERADYIEARWDELAKTRREELGYVIQPIQARTPDDDEHDLANIARRIAAYGIYRLAADGFGVLVEQLPPEEIEALARAAAKAAFQ